jgi:hypothetical protein
VDPHHLDVDPDSEFLFDADPEADPDPTFHPDADPDHSFKKKAQTLEKGLNRLIFHIFWLDICKLMRMRIRFRIQLINFDADPDPDFYLMRMRIWMRIQVTKMMLIFAVPDPQHCWAQNLQNPKLSSSNHWRGGSLTPE